MIDYILGIIGITVSLGLFFVGYRQTVGARKERIKNANTEIEKILIRRIVLEKYTPARIDVSRLLDGKARDYRIRPTELFSEAQILNTVYTRITESDLIPPEQRDEILERMTPVLSELETEPIQEEVVEEITLSKRIARRTQAIVALMAIVTSLVGGLVSIIPELREIKTPNYEALTAMSVTVFVSLSLIVFVYILFRIRVSQEESPNKALELSKYFEFELRVRNLLQKMGVVVKTGERDERFDYIVEHGGRKIVIEVKAWPRQVPDSILARIATHLREAAERRDATESIIVTKVPFSKSSQIRISNLGVKLMTLRELRNYVAHIDT